MTCFCSCRGELSQVLCEHAQIVEWEAGILIRGAGNDSPVEISGCSGFTCIPDPYPKRSEETFPSTATVGNAVGIAVKERFDDFRKEQNRV